MEATHEGIVKDGCLPVPWYLHFGFLVNPFVFWGLHRLVPGPAAWLWPRKFVAGCHGGRTRPKLGVRLNKTLTADAFSLPLAYQQGISRNEIVYFLGLSSKVYHQYPGYLHTRREKLPLLLWPSNWIYWFTFDISLCEIIWGGIVVCRIIFRKWWELVS